MKEKVKDLIFGLALVGVGIYALASINMVDAPSTPGPGGLTFATIPSICSALLIAFSALYVAGRIRDIILLRRMQRAGTAARTRRKAELDPGRRRVVALRLVATLGVLLGYVFLLQEVNFFVITAVFLFVMFFVYGQTAILRNAVIALTGSGGLTLLFLYFLHLPL